MTYKQQDLHYVKSLHNRSEINIATIAGEKGNGK